MEKFGKGWLLIIFLFIFGCKNSDIISPDSDLYDDYTEQTDNVSKEVRKKIKYLNIHCTASTGELTKSWLLNFFYKTRKWSKPGYNYVIHMDGKIDTLVYVDNDDYITYKELSYGVVGVNAESINIAYTGGVDSKLKSKDTRTIAQKKAIAQIVSVLRKRYPNIVVLGHRDHPNVKKACPSFNVRAEFPP